VTARCIGFGEHDRRCQNVADTPAELWCKRCEKLRRQEIDRSFEHLNRIFGQIDHEREAQAQAQGARQEAES
jgi:hypothetical protein